MYFFKSEDEYVMMDYVEQIYVTVAVVAGGVNDLFLQRSTQSSGWFV